MPPVQLSPEADKALNALDMHLVDVTNRQKLAKEQHDAAFVTAFNLFDAVGYENQPVRFVTQTGHIIERRISNPEPYLNLTKLHEALNATPAGQRLWKRIATPLAWNVDLTALQKALERDQVSAETVEGCLETPPKVVSRHFREAAKADAIWLKEQNLLELVPASLKEAAAAG